MCAEILQLVKDKAVALNPAASKTAMKVCLSHDVAVIQWITSCYKNRITTCHITLWREQVTS